MLTQPQNPLTSAPTATDYADPTPTTRPARTIFALALAIILIIQIVLFILVHFTSKLDNYITRDSLSSSVQSSPPATSPAPSFPRKFFKYTIGLTAYFGLIFSILLSLMLLLILNVMLIGRLIGVSPVTTAFILSLIVLLFVFPWQAILNNQDLTGQEWKVPGVLYTWDELAYHGHFQTSEQGSLMRWVRFLLMPIITLILTLTILLKSGRGLRMALGEESGTKSKRDEFDDDIGGADRNMIR